MNEKNRLTEELTQLRKRIVELEQNDRLFKESEERLKTVIDNSPYPIAVVDEKDHHIHYWSKSAIQLFGHNPKTSEEWYELAYPNPEYRQQVIERWKPFLEIAQNAKEAVNTGEYEIYCKNGSIKICEIYAQFIPGALIVTLNDITERKRNEEQLKKIEWLLLPKKEKPEVGIPEYGDLTALNQNRTVLDSVGKEVLSEIVSDYLSLLETSAAVYEKNGDYAVGIFSSEWCQFMDCSSRALCKSKDNKKALESCHWLCHQSCWADASKQSMLTNKAVDIECSGGLHIYAIPIRANNQVIGSINFGYGNPPTDDDKLAEIAANYKVSVDKLKSLSQNYETRPAFIIDIAKQKLETSAKLIGNIVERNQIEEVLLRNQKRYEKAQAMGHVGNWEYDPVSTNFWASDEAKRIYGYDLNLPDFSTDMVERCIPERERVHQALVDLLEHDKKYDLVFDILSHDKGIRKTIRSIAEVERDADGNPKKITGVITDITLQKEAEDKLKALNQLLIANEQQLMSANQQLQASEQQLKASNLQLQANEQQLIAANQQLQANEQQLKAANQQLQASEQQLRASNQQLQASEQQLIAANQQLLEAKEKVENSEKYLENIIKNIADPIFVKDEESKLLLVNDAFCQLFGLKKENIIGKNLAEDVSPAERESFLRIDKVVLHDGKVNINEESLTVRGGQTKIISTKKSRFLDEKGRKFLIGIIRDITERKQSEIELLKAKEEAQESEEKYKALYENAPLAYQSLNEDGSFKDVNPAWLSTLGYKREEVIGKFYKDFLHPSWQSHFEKNFPAFKKRGYVNDVQFKIRHKQGHYLDISFEGCIGYHPDGSFKQTYCVFKDITEEKKALEELVIAKEKAEKSTSDLKLAQQIADIGNWHFDPEIGTQVWSDQVFKIYERNPEYGLPHIDDYKKIYEPDQYEIFSKAFSAAIKEGKDYDIVVQLKLPNSRTKWIRAICKPDLNRKSDSGYFLSGTIQDITEVKKIEQELIKHQNNLEEIVSERTAELEAKNKDLEEFNNLFVGREFRIKELRDQVKELKMQIQDLKK